MSLFSGRRAFVLQRLSALVLLAYLAAAALRLAFGAPVTAAQWQAWAAQPLHAALLLLAAAALIAHPARLAGDRDHQAELDDAHSRLGILHRVQRFADRVHVHAVTSLQ